MSAASDSSYSVFISMSLRDEETLSRPVASFKGDGRIRRLHLTFANRWLVDDDGLQRILFRVRWESLPSTRQVNRKHQLVVVWSLILRVDRV